MKKIYVQIFLIFTVAVFLSACAVGREGKTKKRGSASLTAASTQKTENKRADSWLAAMRSRNDIYWGEGIASLDPDIGIARVEAKKRAQKDLSEKIRVEVKSDIEILTVRSVASAGEKYSESVLKNISEKIETYSSMVLENVKESEFFMDYPKPGSGVFFVHISRKDYQQKVKNDLEQKKNIIMTAVNSGNSDFEKGRFLSGVKEYADAKNKYTDFFNGIPVFENIDNKKIEISSFLDNTISAFFNGVTIELLNSGFQYDSAGSLDKRPKVYARYTNKQGRTQNVRKLPLSAKFIKGKGEVTGTFTGDYGQAEIPVSSVDASARQAVLKITVDTGKIEGLDKNILPPELFLNINLNRKKTVALSVNFSNLGKYTSTDLEKMAASTLINNKYSVLPVNIKNRNSLMNEKNPINADYILIISAKTSGGGNVGGYNNMFSARCTGEISLFRLPAKSMVASVSAGSAQGFGTSKVSAGWDAFGKNKNNIMKKTKQVIDKIK